MMKCDICGRNIPKGSTTCPHCGYQLKAKKNETIENNVTYQSKIEVPDLSRRHRKPIFTQEENKNRFILVCIVVFFIFASIGYSIAKGEKIIYFEDGIVTTDFNDRNSKYIKRSYPEIIEQNKWFQDTFENYYHQHLKVNANINIVNGDANSYTFGYTFENVWNLAYHTKPYQITISAICNDQDQQFSEEEVLNIDFINEITLHELNTKINPELIQELCKSKEDMILIEQYDTFTLEIERNKNHIFIRINQ